MSTRIGLWLPVVVWAGVIFTLSSVPSLSTGLGTWDHVLRTGAHFVEFAILGALLARALDRPFVSAVLAIAYALTDELHQHFVPGRAGTVPDFLVDAAGAIVGVALFRRLRS